MNVDHEMALVDRIFKRLASTYGGAWDRSLGQAPISDVKTVWAHELDAFFRNRNTLLAIAWALENLPDRPPNAINFKNICRQAPMQETTVLPSPKADPDRVKAELAKLAELRSSKAPAASNVHHDWIYKIREKYNSGIKVNPTALSLAKEAAKNIRLQFNLQ